MELKLHPEILMLAARLQAFSSASEFAEEEDAISLAAPKRRAEFRAGRNLARIALRHLGMVPGVLPRKADRSPHWPCGVCGSISHTEDWVIVAVTTAPNLDGVGVDMETAGSVQSEIRAMIRSEEREATVDGTLLFSAKEAVFKAVYPICGEFLEFADVSIFLSDRWGEFRARGRSGLKSRVSIGRGGGRFIYMGNLVISGFWVCK